MNEGLSIFSILFLIPAMLFSAFASLLFKKGAKKLSLKNIFNKTLFFGIILYVISIGFYILSLKYGKLSVVYPLSSLNYILITFLSSKYLNEKINKYKVIGILLIITGTIFVVV